MKNEISILLVGVGGYGNKYVEQLLQYNGDVKLRIVGAVDPRPENCKYYKELKQLNIPFYGALDAFYREVVSADLAVLSTPIQFHCEQTCLALKYGSNVLCEKPMAATVQDARKMMAARDQSGKFVAIGFQDSFTGETFRLKKDIMSGLFGQPIQLKTIVAAPRTLDYYQRGWAARIKDRDGRWILDSVANNATAHFLHHMFYLLGKEPHRSIALKEVLAELYRGNHIENYDTAFIRAVTEDDTEVLFYASHCVKDRLRPEYEFKFDHATVTYGAGTEIKATFKDGTEKSYGTPSTGNKLGTCIEAIRSGNGKIPCGLEAAMSHTVCINAVQESAEITNFPQEMIKYDEALANNQKGLYAKGLNHVMKDCYRWGKLPSELEVPWARAGKTIKIGN